MKNKIMIVDDDPSILITIRELFELEGFEVYTVNDGKSCIEELRKGFKGVILMDIMMPLMDGWETIRQIVDNNLDSGNIISVLTAKDISNSDNINEFKSYVTDYIFKPFDPDELKRIVKNYFYNITKK